MLENLWRCVCYFYAHHKENLSEKKKNVLVGYHIYPDPAYFLK